MVSQHLLEFADLLRERRLGQMQALRCAAKVQLFCDGDKVTQVPQFDIRDPYTVDLNTAEQDIGRNRSKKGDCW